MGAIVLPCLGFALLRALVMMFDGNNTFQTERWSFIAGLLGRGCGPLLMMVVLGARPLTRDLARNTLVPAAVVTSVTGFLALGVLSPTDSVALVACRGLCLAGIGWVYVCWSEVYERVRTRDCVISIVLSMIVSSLLSYVAALLPQTGTAVSAALIPLITVALFDFFKRTGLPAGENRADYAERRGGDTLRTYGTWFLALALFGAMMGAVHAISITSPTSQGGGPTLFDLYTAASVVLAAILLVCVLVRDRFFSLKSCWAVYTALTCAILGASVIWDGALQVALTVFASVRYTALAFLNIKLIDIAHHSKTPLYAVFAIGWGGIQLSMVFGMSLMLNGVYTGAFSANIHIVVLIGVLITGSLFLFSGSTFGDVHFGAADPVEETPGEYEKQAVRDTQYRRCQDLRRLYGLTAREAEVTLLIAQGHTQAYCADSLVVSLNTIRTHMKRIYTKLGIHSKEELLEMLDSVEESGKSES